MGFVPRTTSAPELLDLCDQMGFIVMDEAFDMWKKEKNKFDYHLDGMHGISGIWKIRFCAIEIIKYFYLEP